MTHYPLFLPLLLSIFFQSPKAYAQTASPNATVQLKNLSYTQRLSPNGSPAENRWVDSVFNALDDTARIGQLFMLRAHSDKDEAYYQMVEDQIRRYRAGGLCFFQGTPEKQAELTNRYQALSDRLPLLISMDGETGLGMRLKEAAITFPKQLMLGAVRDNRLLYDMGREIAWEFRRLGVHFNFAPVADVNNNPLNPVINDRSFGEDRYNVTAKSYQYMAGMQDGGMLACAKHFPGHGDTDVDSHLGLPVIPHSAARLDSLELYPFRTLIQYGVDAVMVAHLSVPALDTQPNWPTTLSRPVVTDLLRNKLGFNGLIVTDAMEMKGLANFALPGQAEVEALKAGNDMLLLPLDIAKASDSIWQALSTGVLDREQLWASVKRVLRAKYRLGLSQPQRVDLTNLRRDLNRPEGLLLKRKLIENALTLVRDSFGMVGFPDLANPRFATLALGETSRTAFQTTCGFYAPMDHFNAGKEIDSAWTAMLLDTLDRYDVVLVSLHSMRSSASSNFGLSQSQIELVRLLCQRSAVALTVFGNPYALKFFDSCPTVLMAYSDDAAAQDLAAQALFGARDLKGTLPVTASPAARFGQGMDKVFPQKRMGYDLPEAVGMNSDSLAKMEELVADLIANGAAPGCQILVAKNNKVVWQRAYGNFTYADSLMRPVRIDDLYDLASVTKIGATTPSIMRLVDEGKINLDLPVSTYVPELLPTNKKDLTLREMLVHQAGLQPWIPFYQKTLHNGLPDQHIYHTVRDADSEIPVAPGMWMANAWVDTVWETIFKSDLRPTKDYKYSDLGLYLTARALQNRTGRRLDDFAREHFYRPLGMSTTMFNPWQKDLKTGDSLAAVSPWVARCAPTEQDNYFRYQRLQGYVHDMGAAMLGGVSGHAGLFSDANDLAKLFQMLLNGGSYFGQAYLKPATVKAFTTRYPGSTRRGIGFDMKELNPREVQNVSALAGPNTFGHTGFTGNGIWVDPDQQLIFIFLSNRTFPTMENNKLITGDYRPRLQSIVYQSIKKG